MRESAKVQASLNGLLLCYVISRWRIEADTLTPSCPGGWGGRCVPRRHRAESGGVGRGDGSSTLVSR